jgi:GT2 family glycosyltransferase
MSRVQVLVVGLDRHGLISEDALVRFISTGQPVTAPVARNIGIEESKGRYLAFIDADCIASPDWLAAVVAYQERGIPIVSGSVAFPADKYWPLCYNLTMFHEFLPSAPPGERRNLPTLNLCVARSVVDRVGLLDETLPRVQDTEWTCRMRQSGYSLHFAPEATVTHLPNPKGLGDVLRLWYRSGFYSARIRKQYRDILSAPFVLHHPWLTVLVAPFVSALVTAGIFARDVHTWRYLYTAPVIYATKIAWCLGAAKHAQGSGEPF